MWGETGQMFARGWGGANKCSQARGGMFATWLFYTSFCQFRLRTNVRNPGQMFATPGQMFATPSEMFATPGGGRVPTSV